MSKIINVGDNLFEVLGTQKVKTTDEKGTDYWKKRWRANSVLRNGDTFYYCRKFLDAEYEML